MKKLLFLSLIALQSSMLVAEDVGIWFTASNYRPVLLDEKAQCNPCWMLKRLTEIVHTSNDTESVMKARELIESKFGPECEALRALKSEQSLEVAKYAVIATGICVAVALVTYGAKLLYDKITVTEKTEDIVQENL